MALEIFFYESNSGRSPVSDYFEFIRPVANAAVIAAIQAFSEEFPNVHTVSIKPLQGKIWEIRVRDGSGIQHRVIYTVVGKRLLLLHAFTKKTQKTPPEIIDLAQKRYKELSGDLK